MTERTLKAGDWVHFKIDGSFAVIARPELAIGGGVTIAYGSQIELTQEILDFYGYPNKASWLDRVDMPDEQGRVLIKSGPWPEGEVAIHPDQREAAADYFRQVARNTIRDPAALYVRLAEINERYGRQQRRERTTKISAEARFNGMTPPASQPRNLS